MDVSSLIMIVAMLAVFYFLMIKPENKRKKQAEEMRNSIKKGERITTIGGMVGRVVQINDNTVVFETSEDRVRIEIAKWGIQSTETVEQAAAEQRSAGGGLFGKKAANKDADDKKESDSTGAGLPEASGKKEKKDFDPELK